MTIPRFPRMTALVLGAVAMLSVLAASCGGSEPATTARDASTTRTEARSTGQPDSRSSTTTPGPERATFGTPPADLVARGYGVLFPFPAGLEAPDWGTNPVDELGVDVSFRGTVTPAMCETYFDKVLASGATATFRVGTAGVYTLFATNQDARGTVELHILCDPDGAEIWVGQDTQF